MFYLRNIPNSTAEGSRRSIRALAQTTRATPAPTGPPSAYAVPCCTASTSSGLLQPEETDRLLGEAVRRFRLTFPVGPTVDDLATALTVLYPFEIASRPSNVTVYEP